MMGIQLQLILTLCIVNFVLTSNQLRNQMVYEAASNKLNGDGEVQENFQNLFDSIAQNNKRKSEIYHKILQQEAGKKQQSFDAMKDELRITQSRNSNRKINFYKKMSADENILVTKRETNDSDDGLNFPNVRNCFQEANPFNKPRWEPQLPNREDLLNETYHAAMETLLKLWWRQQKHVDHMIAYRQNISSQVPGLEIQPFDDQLKRTEKLIRDEILVIEDIIWGKRKEVRAPLDKTMIDKLSNELKTLQLNLDKQNLPDTLKKADEYVKKDFEIIIETLKLAIEDLVPYYEQIVKRIEEVETGTDGHVTPHKWVQIKYK